MANLTLAIPSDLKARMERFPEINWSGFIRKAIEEKAKELSWKEELFRKLKDEEDIDDWAVKLQRASRKGRYEELKKKGLI